MKFVAEIDVMPQKAILDPQGKTVNNLMDNLGYKGVDDIRIGKHIRFEIEADTKEKAEKTVNEICKKVLSNPVMEDFDFKIKKL